MRKTIITAMLLGLLAGCNTPSVPQAKKEAYQRWHATRAQILHNQAVEHHKVGQLAKARAKVSEALSLNPNFADGRVLLGKIYIEQGQYALAERELTQARLKYPESGEVLYLLGVAQEKQGLFDDALANYRCSHAVDSSSLEAVVAAAEVLASKGQSEEALNYIESYLSGVTDDVSAYELAGRLAMMQEQYDKAAEYYRFAHDLEGEN
ncbi:MAG: tetratricopeptide repeat protein, partial [Planctomycetota bacterium]